MASVVQTPSREAHSALGLVITATPGANYLNSRHKALAGDRSQAPVSLRIQPEKGLFSWFRKFFTNYPLVGQALKWTLIALSMAALLYFTGGLAAIPFLAPMVMNMGALSLFIFSPVIGGALAALWYDAAKPILSWCASKLFYPHYALRKTEAPKLEVLPDSTRGLIGALGVTRASVTHSVRVDSTPYQGKSPLHSAINVVKDGLPHASTSEGAFSFN